jgi:hypothetical protein
MVYIFLFLLRNNSRLTRSAEAFSLLIDDAEVNVDHFPSGGVDKNVVGVPVADAQDVSHDGVRGHTAGVSQASSHPLGGVSEPLQKEEAKGWVEVV